MRELTPCDVMAISGGNSEGINWWRAGFDLTFCGLTGSVIGAVMGGASAASQAGMVAPFLFAIGALEGGAVGLAIGASVGMVIAVGRETWNYYS